MPAPDRLNTRFSKFFEIGWTVAESGCWEWNGWRDTVKRKSGQSGMGHGAVYFRGRRLATHRLAHEWWNGPVADGLVVRHRCDNPPCVNPAHLEVGTRGDNSRDMWERGRAYQQRMTHFKCGHRVTDENTRTDSRSGARTCRACDNARKLADYHRKKVLTGRYANAPGSTSGRS